MMLRYLESGNSRVPSTPRPKGTRKGSDATGIQEDREQPRGELPVGAGEVTGDKPS